MFDVRNYKWHVNIYAPYCCKFQYLKYLLRGSQICVWCVVWVGVAWHGTCGLVQDVLCGMQDMVGAVHVGQCEVDREVV